MATPTSHNKKSSSVKRILSEARELSSDTSTLYHAAPLEDNIFEWHFTLRGPSNTEFSSGLYHGRILLPAEYPMRPPNLMLLTPNGRWEVGKKICLTFTGFHEEMWQPAWGIRTALLGLQTFMRERGEKAVGVGGLEWTREKREKLAGESRGWICEHCGKRNEELLPDSEERKDEKLPEGLTVDFSAKDYKKEEEEGTSSTSESTPSASVPEAATAPAADSITSRQSQPPALTTVEDASAGPIPPPAPLAVVSEAAPVAQSQSAEIRPRSATTNPHPAIPPRISSSASASAGPTTPNPPSRVTTTNSRISATQQKLTLIDNCIKALSVLVALLVVKRLI